MEEEAFHPARGGGGRCTLWATVLVMIPLCGLLLFAVPFVRRCNANADWQSCTCYTWTLCYTEATAGVGCQDWAMFTDGSNKTGGIVGEVQPHTVTNTTLEQPSKSNHTTSGGGEHPLLGGPLYSTHMGVDPTAQQLLNSPVECVVVGTSTLKCSTQKLLTWLVLDFYPSALKVPQSAVPRIDIVLAVCLMCVFIGGLMMTIALLVLVGAWLRVQVKWRGGGYYDYDKPRQEGRKCHAVWRYAKVVWFACAVVCLLAGCAMAFYVFSARVKGTDFSLRSSNSHMQGKFAAGAAADITVACLAVVVVGLWIYGARRSDQESYATFSTIDEVSINTDNDCEHAPLISGRGYGTP